MTWFEGVITQTEEIHPNLRRFWIQAPQVDHFDFKAGQFVTMDLPIGEKRLQRWRSYSIANAPNGSNILEFCIVRSENGDGTRYLFEQAAPGTTLRFKGPDGAFFLPESIEKDLVLICTGTGVAPFRSMIHDLVQRGKPHRKVHLIFGTRTEAGILYRDEFEQLQQENDWFRYDVVLSRQPDWPGHQGYVHQVYREMYAEKRPDLTFYLCGWSAMIDEAVAILLTELGYDRQQIIYELYG